MTDELRDRLQTALAPAYTLERELGGGGMSRVFVATETALGRRVAVKVLPPELLQGINADRFAREIALAAQLQDPHIVPVITAGTTPDGLPYYTMPFVEGESLRERMHRGTLPLDEALRILRDVAEALEYAHARGIVHRDIKPENVLLSGRNAVVTDFGIAKAVSAARAEVPQGTLTSVGLSLGTPAYMAPEQAAGDTVDHRADLYAWGMLAYELLAGAHPFAARTQVAQLIAAQITEVPRALDEARPGLPPTLGALVMRCLAKLPDERPASATALLALLGAVGTGSTGESSGVRPAAAQPAGRRPRTLVLAALAAVVLLALGGAWVARRNAAASAGPPAIAVLPFEHRGDSADAYITEGLADELRGKLAGVRELAVIAGRSVNAYRGSDKPPREIARELGVRWLLTATVQVVGSAESRRLIVRPELVEVAADGVPRTRWGEPFDAQGADGLRLQGEIAGRVVSAMEVTLVGDDRARTYAVPTTDPAAYDAYLRGRAAIAWGARNSPDAQARAIPLYEEAIRRDSTMTKAWLALATARTLLVANGRVRDPAQEARARAAVERVERLAPGSPDALVARASFTRNVVGDYDAARVLLEQGARRAPGDFRFAGNLGIMLVQHLGRPQEAVAHLARAQMLDPRNGVTALVLADALTSVGRLAEARAAADRALELAPGTANAVERRLGVELVAGDTAEVRRALKRLAPTLTDGRDIFQVALAAGWLLDDSTSARVLAPDADAAGMDRGEWAVSRAFFLFYRGDTLGARAWGDTARRLIAREAQAPSAGALLLSELAYAEALAGRDAAALAAANRAVAALRREQTGRGSVFLTTLSSLAGVAAMAGGSDSAFAWLTEVSRHPSTISGARVAVDPVYARLWDDPRFSALVAGWGK